MPFPNSAAPFDRGSDDAPVSAGADNLTAAIDDPDELAGFTNWRQSADGEKLACSQLQVSGMFCVACAGTIEAALLASPGVVEATVNAGSSRAEVVWAPDLTRPSLLVAAIRGAGYDAAPDLAAPARLLRKQESRQSMWRLFVAGFCMMQVMMYAVPVYVAAPGEMPADQLRLLNWAGWLLTMPVLLFSARPLFAGAWHSLRMRRMSMDVPVVLGLTIAFVASSGAAFDPGGIFGHEVYFDSVTMFIFLLLGARYFELTARHQAASALEAAMVELPERVERLDVAGHGEMIGIRRLRAGDRVRVSTGQIFPADGRLLEGRTHADESLLSGESAALHKGPGDDVIAGSINLLAPVIMRVERVGADTRQEAIVTLMRQAATERPASVRSVDKIAGPFLWGVLLLAAMAALAWSFIDPTRVVWVVVSVLIVTCPCALSLATPSVLLAAGSALARLGLLPRSLTAIEELARIDTVIFDKTGTLTEDRLRIDKTTRQDAPADSSQAALSAQAASLAAWSIHPASRALVAAVGATGSGDPAPGWNEVKEVSGEGLQAADPSGQLFRLGRRSWVLGDAAPSAGLLDANSPRDALTSELCFGPQGVVWVSFGITESLRGDALAAVQRLQALGLHLMIASGDHQAKVVELAARLGIDEAHGDLRPEDKLALLAARHAAGHRILMIGDGLNDAPVLAKANVSIALGHGSQLTRLQADAVLLSARLGAIADARLLALRARRVIRQNMSWAVFYNLICIPLALSGFLPPWAAGAGMAGSSLVVVLNALRVSRLPRSEGGESGSIGEGADTDMRSPSSVSSSATAAATT